MHIILCMVEHLIPFSQLPSKIRISYGVAEWGSRHAMLLLQRSASFVTQRSQEKITVPALRVSDSLREAGA